MKIKIKIDFYLQSSVGKHTVITKHILETNITFYSISIYI